jgi:Pentapeptide repeats (8 copies)
VDRVSFDGSDLSKSVFVNAVLSGTTFTDANLKDTDFTDAYLGPFDLKGICSNPTLDGKNPVRKRSRCLLACLYVVWFADSLLIPDYSNSFLHRLPAVTRNLSYLYRYITVKYICRDTGLTD